MKTKQWITAFVVMSLMLVLTLLPSALVRADFGTNWTAQYYDNKDLSGDPVQTDNGINGINFNWGSGKPISKVDSDKFSIRYTSTQTFGQGTYEFILSSDDGARIFIDGNLVLDRFVSRPLTTDRFQQTLSAGDHSLKVEYFENTDNASIQFQWFLVSAATTPVVVLTPGVGTVVTPAGPAATIAPSGPQASLTFVRGLALRTGPYLGATMITTLTRDTTYNVLGRNRSEGIYNWYLIQTSDGRQGWASGRYLDLNVERLDGSNLEDKVHSLLQWAASRGRVEQLLDGLTVDRPDNPLLGAAIRLVRANLAETASCGWYREPDDPLKTLVLKGGRAFIDRSPFRTSLTWRCGTR